MAVLAGLTGRAAATREENLDRDAVAGLHPPATGCARSDLLDDPDRLVTRHIGKACGKHTGELLVVGPAEPACLYTKEPVVFAHLGAAQSPVFQSPGPF
jgi:hypothetical protein